MTKLRYYYIITVKSEKLLNYRSPTTQVPVILTETGAAGLIIKKKSTILALKTHKT